MLLQNKGSSGSTWYQGGLSSWPSTRNTVRTSLLLGVFERLTEVKIWKSTKSDLNYLVCPSKCLIVRPKWTRLGFSFVSTLKCVFFYSNFWLGELVQKIPPWNTGWNLIVSNLPCLFFCSLVPIVVKFINQFIFGNQ